MKRLPVLIPLLLLALGATWAVSNRATTADASATKSGTSAKAATHRTRRC